MKISEIKRRGNLYNENGESRFIGEERKFKVLNSAFQELCSSIWSRLFILVLSIVSIGVVEGALILDNTRKEEEPVRIEDITVILELNQTAQLLLQYDAELSRLQSDIHQYGADIYLACQTAVWTTGRLTSYDFSEAMADYECLLQEPPATMIVGKVSAMQLQFQDIKFDDTIKLKEEVESLKHQFEEKQVLYNSAYNYYQDLLSTHSDVVNRYQYKSIFNQNKE